MLFAAMGPGCARPAGKKPPDRKIDQIGAELQTVIDWEDHEDPKGTVRDVLTLLRTKYKANLGFDYTIAEGKAAMVME